MNFGFIVIVDISGTGPCNTSEILQLVGLREDYGVFLKRNIYMNMI
ncbi:hypothetical protein Q5M85_10425 [Paraclostridium bifermentans]|nr:hypothetical protein [Paraclostridium bifermentans]